MPSHKRVLAVEILAAICVAPSVSGFVVAPPSCNPSLPCNPASATLSQLYSPRRTATRHWSQPPKKDSGPFDFLFNPYQSTIPKEIEKEIFEAEANTSAAQARGQRVALYAAGAFLGVLIAFFNGFITELRASTTPDGLPFDMEQAGFGWVQANFLTQFLFMNKIGGGLSLLLGGGMGLLAEAEFDTRRINAEKIWEEMQRRRAVKEGGTGSPRKSRNAKKKRRSGKESKRVNALAEVVAEDVTPPTVSAQTVEETAASQSTSEKPVQSDEKKEGLLGGIKGLYEKADNMAASQALLLNKKLEEQGVVEKITDESGLRVIGRDAAKQLEDEKAGGKTE